jgi:hypothetical protein
MDTWIAVEDLWLRFARICPCKLTQRGTQFELRFANFNSCELTEKQQDVTHALLDMNFYRWFQGGCHGSLVQIIDCSGMDLVLQITDLKQIERWDEEQEIANLVRSFALRLQQWGAA